MDTPITDPEYLELTNDVLNELNDAINYIADREGKSPDDILPSYTKWRLKEVRLVRAKLEWEERMYQFHAATKRLVELMTRAANQ